MYVLERVNRITVSFQSKAKPKELENFLIFMQPLSKVVIIVLLI